MPGALTQAFGLGVFFFATLGNQFSVDPDDYDEIPWRETVQGMVASGALFLAAISAASFTQRELGKAREALRPLFNRRATIAQRRLTIETPSSAFLDRAGLTLNVCLRLMAFMLIMVVGVAVLALVLADSPGWGTFVRNLPLDSAATLFIGIGRGIKSGSAALAISLTHQLTTRDSLIARVLPASVTNFFISATPVAIETCYAFSVLGRNLFALVSVPIKLILKILQGPGSFLMRFFLDWICWHGGYLLPWQPYSVGAGIATKKALHGAANSLTSQLGTLAYPCLSAMLAMSLLGSLFAIRLFGPVCARYRSVYHVSQFPIVIGALCATHVFSFFTFDTVRALAIRGHILFGLDEAPEHDNFNWISESAYDPLNPMNIHAIARPLQLFTDLAVIVALLLAGTLYRDPSGVSIFRRRRSIEMDLCSSAAIDDSPMCSAAGAPSIGVDESSNEARGAAISSDVEDEEHPRASTGLVRRVQEQTDATNQNEPMLTQVREGSEGEEEESQLEPPDEEHLAVDEVFYDEEALSEENRMRYSDEPGDIEYEMEQKISSYHQGVYREEDISYERELKYRIAEPNRSVPQSAPRTAPRSVQRSMRKGRVEGDTRSAQRSVRRNPSGRFRNRDADQSDEIDNLLATNPRGDISSRGSNNTPELTSTPNVSGFTLQRGQKTQMIELQREETAGTGGEEDREQIQRRYMTRAQASKRRGGPPSFTSQSSESLAERSDTDNSALLLPHDSSWIQESNVAAAGDIRAASNRTLNAMGRPSLIPQVPKPTQNAISSQFKGPSNENRPPAARKPGPPRLRQNA